MTKDQLFWFFVPAAVSLLVVAPGSATSTLRGDLPRRADLGFSTSAAEGGLVIRRLEPDSAAARVGLQEGDLIVAISETTVDSARSGQDMLRRFLGNRMVSLTVDRGGRSREISFTPPPRPLEEIESVESHYSAVDIPDGTRLRTIITRPEGTSGGLPAIFFLQWVSCGSIEYHPRSTARRILATLAQESGMALIRVERSTSGDSEGPACHELDYETELAHYRHAFDELVQSPHVDPERVVLYGSSLGSTTAPLLAQSVLADGGRIAGVIVQGGGAVTYVERMIAFDRIYLERRPVVDPREVHQEMLDRILFHTEYLVKGRSPDAIAADSPEMARMRSDVRGLADGVHYGRPYAWHQQATRRNFLAAWAEIEAPVLVIFNEFDQFETRHGHRLIADMVNRMRPGSATYVELPRIGHSNELFPSIEDAYADEIGVPVPQVITHQILEWLREKFGGAPVDR